MTEQARQLVELGRFGAARSRLATLLAADPDVPALHGLMAQALLGSDDHTGALRHANQVVALSPDDEWGHRLASIALSGVGQRPEAVRAAREAVRLAPLDWRTHQAFALAASTDPGLEAEARHAADRTRKLAPDEAGSHFVVGLVAQRRGDTEAARSAYRRVLAIQPDHAEAVNNLTVLGGHRRLGTAAHGYAASLRLDPHSPVVQRNIELLALRFARRVYLAGLGALVVSVLTLAASGGHVGAPSIVVAALTVAGLTTYAVMVGRGVPLGIRRFVAGRVLRDPSLLFTAGLSVTMVVLALAAGLVPHGAHLALVLIRPPGLLNLVLVIAARRTRRTR